MSKFMWFDNLSSRKCCKLVAAFTEVEIEQLVPAQGQATAHEYFQPWMLMMTVHPYEQ
jgi:hypothetical protein